MSLNRPEGQDNPETLDFAAQELAERVSRTVKTLDEYRRPIVRWFFRALLAFNLILWSAALPLAFLLLLRHAPSHHP